MPPKRKMNSPSPKKKQYRTYSEQALAMACSAVIKDGMTLRGAANKFCIPRTTLHDRFSGKVGIDCNKSGPDPLLTHEEETKIVQHVQIMEASGYSCTRKDVTKIATDLAVSLGKRHKNDKPMSLHWFYGFLKRFPDIKMQNPRSKDRQKARATSEETVSYYYSHLETILDDNDLKYSPERIYNLDEKSIIENRRSSSAIIDDEDAAVRTDTTTVIGCANAIGNIIPPFFVFKGQHMRDELLDGCVPGTDGTVSDSGCPNSEIYERYLSEHFIKYCTHPTEEKPVLVLYDGHKTNISVSISEWAKDSHVILFMLPAHTSHALQLMAVDCFGPFDQEYAHLKKIFMRENGAKGINKHSICRLAGETYATALTPINLQTFFRKCGIFPFDTNKAGKDSEEVVDDMAADGVETPTKKGKKANTKVAEDGDGDGPPKKMVKKKAEANGQAPVKVVMPTYTLDEQDFSSSAETKDGKPWNLKISTWNVNGIRAWLDKDGTAYLKKEDPDVFCVQETKCSLAKMPEKVNVEGYHAYWSSGEKEGYAGTGMYSKTEPIEVTYGIGIEKHDGEGRTITAEFEKYYLVTAYVPNAGRGLPRLGYRTDEWDVDFKAYLKTLDAKKPVVLCGDLNVAHLDIDLKNPKNNKKTAGFTPQERAGFTNLLEDGFVDSFRHLYPDKEMAYTFWAYFMNTRSKDVGWRLDYFVISERLTNDLCDCVIRKFVQGSDHCPLVLLMNM